MTHQANPSSRDDTASRPIRNHRRFALTGVTFDGTPVGGATIDSWHDGTGAARWSARVLMASAAVQPAGVLAGRMADGRFLRGRVALIGPGPDVRTRGAVLVEWRGTSLIRVETEPSPAAGEP